MTVNALSAPQPDQNPAGRIAEQATSRLCVIYSCVCPGPAALSLGLTGGNQPGGGSRLEIAWTGRRERTGREVGDIGRYPVSEPAEKQRGRGILCTQYTDPGWRSRKSNMVNFRRANGPAQSDNGNRAITSCKLALAAAK